MFFYIQIRRGDRNSNSCVNETTPQNKKYRLRTKTATEPQNVYSSLKDCDLLTKHFPLYIMTNEPDLT